MQSRMLRDLVILVNEISSRSHLRSATLGRSENPDKAFPVAGPVAWNSLPASIPRADIYEQLQTSTWSTFISSRIRTCCLILFILFLFYVLSNCKAPLAELLCARRSTVMMMMMMMMNTFWINNISFDWICDWHDLMYRCPFHNHYSTAADHLMLIKQLWRVYGRHR